MVTQGELQKKLEGLKPAPSIIDTLNFEGQVWALPDENCCKTTPFLMDTEVKKNGEGIIIWPTPKSEE